MATPIVAGPDSAANPQLHGVRVERHISADTYTGSAEQLIAAGIVKPGMFPGDHGRGASMASYAADGQPVPRGNSRRKTALRVSRAAGRGFIVLVFLPEEERRRREAAEDALQIATAEAMAVKREEQRISQLPSTRQAYVAKAADDFWLWVGFFCEKHCQSTPTESGYRLSAADAVAFMAPIREAYRAILRAETAYFPEHRYRNLNEARGKAAKRDPRLQSFIASVVDGASHGEVCEPPR